MSDASGTAEFFEQVALLEAVVSQDFDFAAIYNEVIESFLLAPKKEESFDLPHVDKRLLIMPADSLDPGFSRSQDILCIRMKNLSDGHDEARLLNSIFDACPSRRPRTCFLFCHLQGETKNAARQLNSPLWMEWSIPCSSPCSGGLILDDGWHEESLHHAEKIMKKFVSTLAPEYSRRARILVFEESENEN